MNGQDGPQSPFPVFPPPHSVLLHNTEHLPPLISLLAPSHLSPSLSLSLSVSLPLSLCLCSIYRHSRSIAQSKPSPAAMVRYTFTILPQKPLWLEALLSEKFFTACSPHLESKKNEKNIYCIDCSVGICQHCLSSHASHRFLQIRRYVYHDVIRLHDIQKLIDCSHVQAYIINSAKVVFLNQRPQPRPTKGPGNVCSTCERSLQDAFKYCSVACKVDAYVKQGKDLQSLLPRCEMARVSISASSSPGESMKEMESRDQHQQLSPNSVLDATYSPTSSGSTANDGVAWGISNSCSTAATSQKRPVPATGVSKSGTLPSIRRRKGTPWRAPLC